MKDKLENRENDWLADELKREKRPQQLDFNEGRKLKEEHLRLHRKSTAKSFKTSETAFGDLLIIVLLSVIVIICIKLLIQSLKYYSNPAYSLPQELFFIQSIPLIIFATLLILFIFKVVKGR